ncbi:hypothetical protein [Streptomyces sp. NPDC088725]|uniref:hypothetical protein n=1 Tax=Streptomyces sp. NPDC088725 TaxID=3365873 RepID=UPI003817186F
MTGTDNAVGESVDQDAFYVLTAVLLTPAQFPSVLGDDYPGACGALGLQPFAGGYGLVLGQDADGARWTVVVDDVSLVAVAIASWDCGMEYDLSPRDDTVVASLPGWPLALAVATPGVPAPHDPKPEPAAGSQEGPGAGDALPALEPPDTEIWGPAQRRLGADEIALQWTAWREQFDAGEQQTETARTSEAAETTQVPQTSEPEQNAEADRPPPPSHPGVRKALAALHGYVDAAPPPGRVRSTFAPEGARTLRADGPGWSFVARTDDMAFILLDDEPGEVMPVGRGSELPRLLQELDAMAVRPS